MNYKLITRHFEASKDFAIRVDKKMKKLSKFDKWINHIEVIINEEGDRRDTQINVFLNNKQINAKEEGKDAYQTFSKAFTKIKKQIRKFEDQVTDHYVEH
ncbi:MAG: ribosome-associated translation inhibitor RaiA [candidate division WOR-3 bacterium]|nr:ribosome-associated translation inhibitor RaiA [candidate division WOR-3 bacterium]